MADARTEARRRGGLARAASTTPEQRREIARKARFAAVVNEIVDRAPELSPEQADRLRAVLSPAAAQLRDRAGTAA
jgi:hypothetical protein